VQGKNRSIHSVILNQQFAFLVILSLSLGFIATSLPPFATLTLLALMIGLCIAYSKPHWLLIILLLVRSSTDEIQEIVTFFPGHWYSFNIAGLLNIVSVAFGILVLTRRFLRNDRLLPSPPVTLLLMLIGVSLLSIPQSEEIGTSLKAWVRLMSYFGIALVSYDMIDREQISMRKVLRGITIASIPPLILGYYQAISGSGYFFPGYQSTSFAYRPQGTFGHPAILASFLMIIICITLASYFLRYPLWSRPILIFLAISSMGLLILTFARTQWIGAAVAIGVIGLLRSRKMLFIGIVLVVVLTLTVPVIRERIQGEQATESFEWRVEVWQASLRILRNPTLFGTGLDTSHLYINNILVNVFVPPHNDYLRMAIETGLVGLLTYLFMQIGLFIYVWRAYCQNNQDMQVLALALLGIIIGGWVISIFDNYLSFVSVQWYLWSMVGILAGLNKKQKVNNQLLNVQTSI
jgi:putative inorganic carbon (HCO3(-)) transporter